MTEFWLWFSTGLDHITDLGGYDHVLFVTLLVLSQPLTEWKRLLLLVTGFTLGHSVTLALSVVRVLHAPQALTELLIALSILLAAAYNALHYKKTNALARPWVLFALVALFGLIHGLGFSYLLRGLLGAEHNVILPLLYFNLGLEAGQLLIVTVVLLFSLFLTTLIKCPFHIYKLIVVCFIGLVALWLCLQRLLELF